MTRFAPTRSQETREWLEAMRGVLAVEGPGVPASCSRRSSMKRSGPARTYRWADRTPYVNTIPVDRQPAMPGDRELEARLRHIVRWNALATVVRANKVAPKLGGPC